MFEIFRRKQPDPQADRLRDEIFATARRGGDVALLCASDPETILKNFQSWIEVPADKRGDPVLVYQHKRALMLVANYFKAAGNPQLAELITPPTEQIREELFGALARSDRDTFFRCCALYTDSIATNFKNWLTVPEPSRGDRAATEQYVKQLVEIARYFKSLGRPELLQQLMPAGESVFDQVYKKFTPAQRFADLREFAKSNEVLHQILDDMKSWGGSGVPDFRAKVYGLLGTNYFHLQDLEQAHRYTTLALQDCQASGDHEGIRIYTANLSAMQ
jgi:hypothetical protein